MGHHGSLHCEHIVNKYIKDKCGKIFPTSIILQLVVIKALIGTINTISLLSANAILVNGSSKII
jgi:hypothetical protein